MELKDIIRQYRKEHHLTTREFAERTGISKSYVSVLERGTHPSTHLPIVPTIDTIDKCARGMNMTSQELYEKMGGGWVASDDDSAMSEIRLISYFAKLSNVDKAKVVEYAFMLSGGKR